MFEAYFDESETHPNSSFVCVAGYLFSKEMALKFAELWEQNVKPLLPKNVEVFHAVDCYALSKKDRDTIFDAMIEITKDTIDRGIVVGVARSEYENAIKRHQKIKRMIGTKYTLCALRCAEYLSDWLLEDKIEGDITYYFEDGNKHRGELENFLKTISYSPLMKQKYRLKKYGFYAKNEALQLQASDLLAWEWQRSYATAFQPGCERREWRITLPRLVKKPHKAEHITPEGMIIKAMVNIFNRIEANPKKKRVY